MVGMGMCSVCRHALRPAIDAALVAGERILTVTERFGVGLVALKRHRARHLPRELVEAAEAARGARGDSLLAQLQEMQRRAWAYEAAAHAAGDRRAAVLALREGRAMAELIVRLCPEALKPIGPEPRFEAVWPRALGQAKALDVEKDAEKGNGQAENGDGHAA